MKVCAPQRGHRISSSGRGHRSQYRRNSFRRLLRQRDADGLADPEFFRMLGARLNEEYELGSFFHAVDDRRRKFSTTGDEADLRSQILIAAIAGYAADIS